MSRSFVIPAASNGSPDSAARKRRMAEIMLAQSAGAEPISSPWQGAAKLAQALMGGLAMKSAERSESKGREGANAALLRALTGDAGVAPSQSDPMGALVQGINDPWQSDAGRSMLVKRWEQQNTPYKPDYKTIESNGDILRYDANDPNSKPELFFDAPDAPPDPMKAIQLEREKFDLEQARKKAATPEMPKPAIENPMTINKDFNSQEGMGRIKTIAPIIGSMYQSLSDPSAMADMDFIYGLVKILDPTSVVRESETGMVIESQGIAPQLLGQLNKIASGDQAMLPDIRQKLFNVAIRRAEELQKQAQGERGFYEKMATANQHDPATYLQQVPGLPKWQKQAVPDPYNRDPMTGEYGVGAQPAPPAPPSPARASPVTSPIPSPTLGAVGSNQQGKGDMGNMAPPKGWEAEWPYLSEAEKLQVLQQGIQ